MTGSRAADVVAFQKNGAETAARRDYRLQLVTERLTGCPAEDNVYRNEAVQRGIDLEPAAIAAYEALTDRLVRRCGFVRHAMVRAGASPDGYVGDFVRLVSVKCPKSATHLRYFKDGIVPTDYVPQMLHELWLLPSVQAYDFVSFDDRFPGDLELFVVSVERSALLPQIAAHERAVLAFLDEVERDVQVAQTLGRGYVEQLQLASVR